MIKLSYSTFGLTNLGILDAIDAVAAAGYEGIELSFHRRQFNPFEIDSAELDAIGQRLRRTGITPACVATASHFFTPSRPHEPSLMTLDVAGRKRRIDLVKRGIRVARHLGVPLVTFGSGFIREEHLRNPSVKPLSLLVESIHACLGEIRDDEDITLLIEPEPGMFIETTDEALALMEAVASPRFRLHVDLCHAWCSEADGLGALAKAAPYTRYLHISDAPRGYNLKIVRDGANLDLDLHFASTLVYFPDDAAFLLVDRNHPLYFCDTPPDGARGRRVAALLEQAGVAAAADNIDYASLYPGRTAMDDEIFTYLISVPGLSFEVLERARPIIAFLRGASGPARVRRMVANTRTGIVHFHEIPGAGVLDLGASFRTLVDHGFHGFGSVELYHHVESWREALTRSHRHLAQLTEALAQPA